MGVPRFYRWLVERYPQITTDIDPSKGLGVEIDNLYLDLNSIIHQCTHANIGGLVLDMNEDVVMGAVFEYIERIFAIVRPRKLLYMAIDGVAPRAKMNQQRARRFKSALEWKKEVEEMGIDLETTTTDIFDSNVITPGTPFMGRIHEHLKFFIASRIKTDACWKAIEVVLSGDVTPGEGEHKIYDYVRRCRALDELPSTTTHCVYGLDADLIVMSLLTHEPYFYVFREEIRFDGGRDRGIVKLKERKKAAHMQQFQLVHLSLLREYVELDFGDLGPIERLIDDIVFLSFQMGNDFVPCMPYLEIINGAMNFVFSVYKKYMTDFPGAHIIDDGGHIQWGRYLVFLNEAVKYERYIVPRLARKSDRRREKVPDNFLPDLERELTLDDEKDTAEGDEPGKDPINELLDGPLEPSDELDGEFGENVGKGMKEAFNCRDFDVTSISREFRRFNFSSVDITEAHELRGDEKNLVEAYKVAYYMRKFGVPREDNRAFVRDLVLEYLKTVQWIWEYYYNGLQSWSWYFGHHFPPFMSDVLLHSQAIMSTVPFEFETSEPANPFMQLLCVLPPTSFRFIPDPYVEVLDDQFREEFFPDMVRTDMEAKRYEWEAVPMLPFIDISRLTEAYNSVDKERVTNAMIKRNTVVRERLFRYDENEHGVAHSTLEEIPDIDDCQSVSEEFSHPGTQPGSHDHLCRKPFAFGPHLRESVRLGQDSPPGVETLSRKPFSRELRMGVVQIFQFPARQAALVVQPSDPLTAQMGDQALLEAVDHVLGRVVCCGWPHKRDFYITTAETATYELRAVYELRGGASRFHIDDAEYVSEGDFFLNDLVSRRKNPEEIKRWSGARDSLRTAYGRKGVSLPFFAVILHGFPVTRRWISSRGVVRRLLQLKSQSIPITLCNIDPEEVEKGRDKKDANIEKKERELKPGECGVLLRMVSAGEGQRRGYSVQPGSPAEYVGPGGEGKVIVNVKPLPSEERLVASRVRQLHADEMRNSLTLPQVASEVRMKTGLLSRLLSSVVIRDASLDIGLRMKYDGKKMQLPGFVFRDDEEWRLTEAAVNVVRKYIERFRDIIENLSRMPYTRFNRMLVKDIFPDEKYATVYPRLLQVSVFVDSLPHVKVALVPAGTDELSTSSIRAVEELGSALQRHREPQTPIRVTLPASACYFPPGDPSTADCLPHFLFRHPVSFEIGDRLINVANSSKVPFGMHMTVVGIGETGIDVLFDEKVVCASDLNGRCTPQRGGSLPLTSFVYKLPSTSYTPAYTSHDSGSGSSRLPQQSTWGGPRDDLGTKELKVLKNRSPKDKRGERDGERGRPAAREAEEREQHSEHSDRRTGGRGGGGSKVSPTNGPKQSGGTQVKERHFTGEDFFSLARESMRVSQGTNENEEGEAEDHQKSQWVGPLTEGDRQSNNKDGERRNQRRRNRRSGRKKQPTGQPQKENEAEDGVGEGQREGEGRGKGGRGGRGRDRRSNRGGRGKGKETEEVVGHGGEGEKDKESGGQRRSRNNKRNARQQGKQKQWVEAGNKEGNDSRDE